MKKIISLIGLTIFATGFWYENPSSTRAVSLIASFAFLFISLWLVEGTKKRQGLSLGLWILSSISIGFLEHFSKYSVNEYFQLLYFLLPLSLYSRGHLKYFKRLSLLSAGVLSYKYLYLISVKWEAFKLQSLVVALVLYGLVSVVMALALSLKLEKQQLAFANEALKERTRHLEDANDKLNGLMDALEQLTVVRERQNMAREIHDTVGHGLTALIMKLEMSRHFFKAEDTKHKGEALLEESVTDARNALRATRQVVETLNSERRSGKDLEVLVTQLASDPSRQVSLEGAVWLEALTDKQTHALYRAVQEGITNYLKHSPLPQFEIRLVYIDKTVKLTMNGEGKVQEGGLKEPLITANAEGEGGFGLKAMKQRIEETGGQFSVVKDASFLIEITYPGERIIGGADL